MIIPSFIRMILFFLMVIWTLAFGPGLFAEDLPQPQWDNFGRLINDTPGNSVQQNPKMVADRQGNYFIVWEDGRSGAFDLYAQKINSAGDFLWLPEGIPICTAPGPQNFLQVLATVDEGIIVVWQDYRWGQADIYAQKINSGGEIPWEKDGIALCTASSGQFAPKLVSDAQGGAIIVWHDYRSGKGEDLYAQRIDKNGNRLWQDNGVPVSLAVGTQWFPEIVEDGGGGAVVVWTDGRSGADNTDLYAQRIDPQGKGLWEKEGIAICSAPKNQTSPKIIFLPEGNFILVWSDARSNISNIYAQKIDGAGKFLWEKAGLPLASFPMIQAQPTIASNNQGGAIIVWQDQRDDEGNIYGQQVRKDGALLWGETGHPVSRAPRLQEKPLVFKMPGNSWMVLWQDERGGNTDLFLQKIEEKGKPLGNPLIIVSTQETQQSPSVAVGQNNEFAVAWQDNRFGADDLYLQKFDENIQAQFENNGRLVNATRGSVIQHKIRAVETTFGEVIVVFEDARAGYFNLYAQKINPQGEIAWGINGIALARGSFYQRNPQIIRDDQGGAIIVWQDYRYPAFPKIFAQRINAQGKIIWPEGGRAMNDILSSQIDPQLISDGQGGAIVVWAELRDPLNGDDVFAQKISAEGKLLWGKKGKEICTHVLDQREPAIIGDALGGAYVVWTDYRLGDRNPDIYAQRIDKKGEILWPEKGILVCGAADFQNHPTLIKRKENEVIIAWTDKAGGSFDIYAQRINSAGQILWLPDGLPVSQMPRAQQKVQIASMGVMLWEDYRFGNWDIFAQKVESHGKLAWEEKGIPIVISPFTQYAPQIAEDENRHLLIAWEDYRSGEKYEVFIQKINGEGEIIWPENGVQVKTKSSGRSPQILFSQINHCFYLFWEDIVDGGSAIFGQKFKSP